MSTDTHGYGYFESDAKAMLAERQCERTVLAFTAAFDLRNFDGMSGYFAQDGLWKRQDGNVAGIVELKQMMDARPEGLFVRHVITNLRTTFTSSTTAVVDAYVTVFRQDFPGAPKLPAIMDGPALMGRYRDELAATPNGWQITQREVKVDFKQRPSPATLEPKK